MMDPGTSVPTRPMRIILRQAGCGGEEILDSGSTMNTGPRTWCIPQAGTPRSLDSLLQTLRIRSQVAAEESLACKRFGCVSKTEVYLVTSLPQGRRSCHQAPSKMGGDMSEDAMLHRHPLSIVVPIHQSSDTDQGRASDQLRPTVFQRRCMALPPESDAALSSGAAVGQGRAWVHSCAK